MLAILLLPLEILKATKIGVRSIVDHMLSMAVFILDAGRIPAGRQAGTSTFFLLMMISIVDVMAGFIVTLRTAQRDSPSSASNTRPDAAAAFTHVARFPSARPLAGHCRRRHGGDLASARHARRDRRAARRRQRRRCGGDRRRRAVRDRAAHDRHRRRLLRLDRRAGQAGVGLQRLRPRRRQGLDRGAACQGHAEHRGDVAACGKRARRDRSLGRDPEGAWHIAARPRAGAGDPLCRAWLPGRAAGGVRLEGIGCQARQQPRRDAALSVQRKGASRRRRHQAAGAGGDAEGDREERPARVLRRSDRRGHGRDLAGQRIGADSGGFRQASRRGADADLDQLSRHRSG